MATTFKPNPKQTSKQNARPRQAALIAALSRCKHPTVQTLADTLSLQPHSVRAAISGLRKAGYQIETEPSPSGGAARYRLVAAPAAQEGST